MMLILIVILATGLRLWHLNSIPGEMWGDVIQHYKLVLAIQQELNIWPHWWGSDGPIFPYMAYIVSIFTHLSFNSLKITSAIIGSLSVIAEYFMALAVLKNKRLALIACFLVGVSFWGITFSRQAKGYILAPLMVTLVIWALARKKRIWAGLLMGIGMFTQASFWGAVWFGLYNWVTSIGVGLFIVLLVINQKSILFNQHTYLGEKVFGNSPTVAYWVKQVSINFSKNITSLFYWGDKSFRHNIPGKASLDPISAGFLVCGLVMALKLMVKEKRYILLWFVILPLIFLQIPSILDISNPNSTPNMGRMLVVTPIIFLLIALGIDSLISYLPSIKIQNIGLGVVLASIFLLNTYAYFWIYPQTLPNKNVPFAKNISEYINQSIAPDLPVLMYGCCWGDWGQPEPQAVRLQITAGHDFFQLEKTVPVTTIPTKMWSHQVLVVTAPDSRLPRVLTENSFGEPTIIEKSGYKIAKVFKTILQKSP